MLILLVGPNGGGKSHVGRLLESRLGVRFFHVEPHWMAYHAACADAGRPVSITEGVAHIHPLIEEALEGGGHVCVETTGASAEILDGLLSLGRRFGLLLVRVEAPLPVCLRRVAARDRADQIPMGEAGIREVYARSASVELPYDVVLDNAALADEEILRPFREAGVGEA